MATFLTITKLVSRILQAVLSVVAVGTAAYILSLKPGPGPLLNGLGYTVFVGITYFFVCVLFIVTCFIDRLQSWLYGIAELVISGVYFVLWLAVASTLAANSWHDFCSSYTAEAYSVYGKTVGRACECYLTAEAMGWVLWICCVPHVVFASLEVKSRCVNSKSTEKGASSPPPAQYTGEPNPLYQAQPGPDQKVQPPPVYTTPYSPQTTGQTAYQHPSQPPTPPVPYQTAPGAFTGETTQPSSTEPLPYSIDMPAMPRAE